MHLRNGLAGDPLHAVACPLGADQGLLIAAVLAAYAVELPQ
jgi:hypothetical protein